MSPAHRKYTEEVLRAAVERATSVAGVLRLLDLAEAGGTHAHVSRTIKRLGIDTSHFVRHQGSGAFRRLSPDDILVRILPGSRRTKPHLLKRALLESGREHACAGCAKPGMWRAGPLTLEVDHIDGDYHNNEAWNLRFLCPNCHSQTDSFSGRSRGKLIDRRGQLRLFGSLRPNE